MLWTFPRCSSQSQDFLNEFLTREGFGYINEILFKHAWGEDALEFNPDRFNETKFHPYQEALLIESLIQAELIL